MYAFLQFQLQFSSSADLHIVLSLGLGSKVLGFNSTARTGGVWSLGMNVKSMVPWHCLTGTLMNPTTYMCKCLWQEVQQQAVPFSSRQQSYHK